MKLVTTLSFAALLTLSANASANLISNGDFSTCDFTGWNKDTDGFGDISYGNDFEIDSARGGCRAAINVDYFDPIGDPFGIPVSEAWFANTLFQELDFTGNTDSTFELTISYEASAEGGYTEPSFIPDYFLIGLNDGAGNYYNENGNLGFLIGPTDIDGAFRNEVTFNIDSSFANQTGWFLDFQVDIGWDGDTGYSDAFGSTLYINSVEMAEVVTETKRVTSPPTLYLLLIVLAGAIKFRRKNNKW